ncbi:MAG: asparagine synthase (glutamine-hydrolyzing) [gamma proteobacterium endosymbiont of Lamellibrachia anaximandri]|nr:asparagine synthase (glutamine-hydrolyzing) [gamma proteobacterium endosymbiont of Lamellibrachia anaximandri]MBL3617800.1 asparagine synthase (glutamine-hydrolyzing) [gamma proteobacterium endosymbiont of Lamellibrachia anaximandri]
MCGIAGIAGNWANGEGGLGPVRRMISQITHRGPDDEGYFSDFGICLGHARLSIIDLDSGHQPIANEDKSIHVVFNGEIFNYIELRSDLIKSGHHFSTHSDTEVIVHLYEDYGDDFVRLLNGQFSIALWDANKQKLLLVRDRVGIVPLFYTRFNNSLIFASEIKAIIPVLNSSPSINVHALDQIMTFWNSVGQETIFEGIYELEPGNMMVFQGGDMTIFQYWEWEFSDAHYGESDHNLAGQLEDLLDDATRIRLRADVPVGAYLSGGLDSSVLTALVHRYKKDNLRTFSIGFDDKSFDESDYQKEMIEHLGSDHSHLSCTYRDISDSFLQSLWNIEAPILRTAPVPMGLLSGMVREQGYKVVLTGEGADEVFGGYDIFKETKIRQFWAKNPDSSFRAALLKKLYPYLNISQPQALVYLKSFFGAGLDDPSSLFFSHIPRWLTTAKTKAFFSEDINAQLSKSAVDSMSERFAPAMSNMDAFQKAQFIESRMLMPGYLLSSQGDRMLMKNSVEGRFPFLDHRVIEFANGMHPTKKMKVLNEKYLLKFAMRKHVPEKIINRFKQPYRAPDIPAFFRDDGESDVTELLGSEYIKKYGFFDDKKVSRLVEKIRRGRATSYKDNMALVGILSTQAVNYLFVEQMGNRETIVKH